MSEAVKPRDWSATEDEIPAGIPVHEDLHGKYVTLNSDVAGRTILFEQDHEERDYLSGNYVVRKPGARLKFEAGRAKCYLEWFGAIMKHPEWQRSIFFAEDPRANTQAGPAIQVGMASTAGAPGSSRKSSPSFSPPDGWDAKDNSELIGEIKLGTHDPDLEALVGYEVSHRNRSQVITSLSKRVRDLHSEEE